jgi:uncharacterized protein YbjT (DUF2867 family)
MLKRTAIVLGATGLIGKHLVRQLTEDPQYGTIRIFVRRPTGWEADKLEEHVIDFNQMEEHARLFQVDDVFCALGTTMKKAKSKEAFRLVDYEYPLKAGKLAKTNGAKQYLLVSATGANPRSVFFYSRVKGEIEEALKKLQLPALHIFRPSLLLGKREEFRLAEHVGAWVATRMSFLFSGPLKKYAAIEGKTVAKAMIEVAKQEKTGVHIYPSEEIQHIADLA